MRLAVAALFLLASTWLFAQTTLPGQDLVGSDRALHRGDQDSQIVNSPDINAQLGGYTGETTGEVVTPGLQSAGTDARTNLQSPAEAGQGSQTGATAARRSAAELSAQEHGLQTGDNGSVWDANTVRKSNVVRMSNSGNARTATSKATEPKP